LDVYGRPGRACGRGGVHEYNTRGFVVRSTWYSYLRSAYVRGRAHVRRPRGRFRDEDRGRAGHSCHATTRLHPCWAINWAALNDLTREDEHLMREYLRSAVFSS
jgi:hypothetical protein